MERKEIIEACQAWAQENENRAAVVVLTEPDENGGSEGILSKFLYGNGIMMACALGNEINDDRNFATVIQAAVKVALIMRTKAEAEDLGEELSDLLKKKES